MKSFLVESVVSDDAVFFFAIVWNEKEVNDTILVVFFFAEALLSRALTGEEGPLFYLNGAEGIHKEFTFPECLHFAGYCDRGVVYNVSLNLPQEIYAFIKTKFSLQVTET